MEYFTLAKHIHMTAAGLSFLGFLIRGYWMMTNSKMLHVKPVKILPHIIDTLLLGAAIYLVVVSHQYPFVVNWLTAKLLLLVVYIVAGTIAIKPGKTKKKKITAFLIAVVAIISMFAIASIKPALSF